MTTAIAIFLSVVAVLISLYSLKEASKSPKPKETITLESLSREELEEDVLSYVKYGRRKQGDIRKEYDTNMRGEEEIPIEGTETFYQTMIRY
jgi:hypothetical protein